MQTTDEAHEAPERIDFGSFMELRESAARQYAHGDRQSLGAIATEHPPATYFGPLGEIRRGPDRVRETYEQGAPLVADGLETRFEVFQSAASDGLAYWVGLQHATTRFADADEPRHVVLRVTELFRREKGGEWKLIHRHADALDGDR